MTLTVTSSDTMQGNTTAVKGKKRKRDAQTDKTVRERDRRKNGV